MIKSLVLLRYKDLRLNDNPALNYALTNSDEVFIIYVNDNNTDTYSKLNEFTEKLIADILRCMYYELQGKLSIVSGSTLKQITNIIKSHKINLLTCNQIWEPYYLNQDIELTQLSSQLKINFKTFNSSLINDNIKPYKVFRPFYESCLKNPKKFVREPNLITIDFQKIKSLKLLNETYLQPPINNHLYESQINKLAISCIENLSGYYNNRKSVISYPNLSKYLSCGRLSLSYIYDLLNNTILPLGDKKAFERQLFMRQFSMQWLKNHPNVTWQSYNIIFDKIPCLKFDKNKFTDWCNGSTNNILVNAAMTQLANENYLPNYLRMIVANYLVKNLHISWTYGERYFANKLLDFDLASNVFNWQFTVGAAGPIYNISRYINSDLQLKIIDPDLTYCHKYLKGKSLSLLDTYEVAKNFRIFKDSYKSLQSNNSRPNQASSS